MSGFKNLIGSAVLLLLALAGNSASANGIGFTHQGRDAYGQPGWVAEVDVEVLGEAYTIEAGVYRLVDDDRRLLIEAFCLNVLGCENPEGDFAVWGWLPKAVERKINLLYAQSYDDVRDSRSAAAFQLALWEIVTDSATGLDLTSGNFRSTGEGFTYMLAQDFIDRIVHGQTNGSARRIFTAASDGSALVGTTVSIATARRGRRPLKA